MDKQLVILVPTEAAAYQVMKTLRALDESGALEVHSATVLTKTANGSVVVKDEHQVQGPWGTVVGLSSGALIGLLAGPVGAAIGATVGGAAGLGSDIAYSGFAGEFVRDVEVRLQPGWYAVCASVWEDWTVPLDQELAPLGALVYRQATSDMVTAQIRANWQALKEDEAQLEAEISRAAGESRVKLETKRAELRAKIASQRERLRKQARTVEEGWNAKIESVKAKAEAARAEAKARHEAHVEKLSKFAAVQKAAFRDLSA